MNTANPPQALRLPDAVAPPAASSSWNNSPSSSGTTPGLADPSRTFFFAPKSLGQLAALEDRQKNFPRAIEHLIELKSISPNTDSIQKWIDEVKVKQ